MIGSFIGLCIATFLMFFLLAHYMEEQSSATISQVGGTYMKSLSEQISMHFGTTIDLRPGPGAEHGGVDRPGL